MKKLIKAISLIFFVIYSNVLFCQNKIEPTLMLPFGHAQSVESAVFSPDGLRIVTASYDGTALIIDAQSGVVLQRLVGHSSSVNSAAFSPDGGLVLTTSSDGTARIWDTKSGKLLHCLQGQDGEKPSVLTTSEVDYYLSAEFSPDGKRVLTAWDNIVKIWDTRSGALLRTLYRGNDPIYNWWGVDAKFCSNGRFVLSVYDEVYKLWNAQSGVLIDSFDRDIYPNFSSDGSRLVTKSDYFTQIWNVQSRALLHNLAWGKAGQIFIADPEKFDPEELGVEPILDAIFSPDGKLLLTLSEDKARIWDVRSGVMLHLLGEPNSSEDLNDGSEKYNWYEKYADDYWEGISNYSGFSPDGNRILTVLEGNTRIWDAKSGVLMYTLIDNIDIFTTVKFSPDSKYVITVYDTIAQIWNAQNGALQANLEHFAVVSTAEFSPDGRRLVTTAGNEVYLWDALKGNLLHHLKGHSSVIENCYVSSDVTTVTIEYVKYGRTEANNQIFSNLWDVQRGKDFGNSSEIKDFIYSPNGRLVGIIYENGNMHIWDVQTGSLLLNLNEINEYEISSNSRLVGTITQDGHTRIWDMQTGTVLLNLIDIKQFEISSDSRLVVTNSLNGTTQIWDMQTGTELLNLNNIEQFEINSDSRLVVTNSLNGTTQIWDMQTQSMLLNLSDLNRLEISSSGSLVAIISNDGSACILDTESGVKLFQLKDQKVRRLEFSPDSRYLVMLTILDSVLVWDAHNSVLLQRLKVPEFERFKFSPDGRSFLTFSSSGQAETRLAQVWELNRGVLLSSFIESVVEFSPNGHFLVTANTLDPGPAKVWETESWTIVDSFEWYDYGALHYEASFGLEIKFSPDGRYILMVSEDNTTKLWDAETRNLLFNFEGDCYSTPEEIFTSNRVVTTVGDTWIRLYNLTTGELIYSLILFDSTDYLVLHPDGFFDGTQTAREQLYFVCNEEVVDLEQLKDALYIPGLVDIIMSGQTITSKKLSELDICQALPLVDSIVGKRYHYRITPRKMGLERAEVYVNGKRVLNFAASTLRRVGKSYELVLDEKALSLHLVPGALNKVSVQGVVRTVEGSELRSRGLVVSTPGTKDKLAAPRLFALMIGINDYKDPAKKLQYPVKDAQDMGRAIEAAAVNLLGRENVTMYMVHSQVKPGYGYSTPEKEGIRKALEEIGKIARPEDVLFIFFAGHGGVQESGDKLFTLLTAEASQLNPNIGINTRELQDWLSYEGPHKMRANKTILILDACNSGQVSKELTAMLARSEDESRLRIKQVEDLKDKSGMFILAASAADQSAYEVPSYAQGLLTYSLLSVLKNNPDVLDDGKFLNVQKWFLESEQMQKQLAESLGFEQSAQPLGTANIRIGIVDDRVRESIVLAKEKPLVLCDNALNSETLSDNLQLKKLINTELSNMSSMGVKSQLVFASKEAPKSNKINIFYNINGDQITCEMRLIKDEVLIHKSSLAGSKTNLTAFVKNVVETVILYAK